MESPRSLVNMCKILKYDVSEYIVHESVHENSRITHFFLTNLLSLRFLREFQEFAFNTKFQLVFFMRPYSWVKNIPIKKHILILVNINPEKLIIFKYEFNEFSLFKKRYLIFFVYPKVC